MRNITLRIQDETKVDALLEYLRGLPYVEAQADCEMKKWNGKLTGFLHPVHVENFRVFSREELHERQVFYRCQPVC